MLYRLFLLIICLVFLSGSEAVEPKRTICLNMIVKNESKVIEACLASVKPFIDYWVIVDTGSDDNTKEIIKDFMKDVPGELHERPWVNFAHNRNEALSLAKNKGDYVLLIDADEVLQCSENCFGELGKDIYLIPVRVVGVADTHRNGLINNHLNWWWEGVIHEDLRCPEVKSVEVLKGAFILYNTHNEGESGRSRDSSIVKCLRDIEVLEKALSEDPNNSRYLHYLGISYAVAGNFEGAKKSFEKRITVPSPDRHETYLTMYYLGVIQEDLGDLDAALLSFAKAYEFHPIRAEPLVHSARIYHQKGNLSQEYLLYKRALTLPFPEKDANVEYPIYDHLALLEFVNCAFLFGKFQEALDGCLILLANPNLPPEYKPDVIATYERCRQQL